MSGDAVYGFHAHLDECEWCFNHPFDLCGVGHELLVDAAKESELSLASLQPIRAEVTER